MALWPTAYETLSFIEDYERARDHSFTAPERRTAIAGRGLPPRLRRTMRTRLRPRRQGIGTRRIRRPAAPHRPDESSAAWSGPHRSVGNPPGSRGRNDSRA